MAARGGEDPPTVDDLGEADQAPRAPPVRPRTLLLVALVACGLVAAGGVVLFVDSPPPQITILVIAFDSPDNACGLAGSQDIGFNTTGGSVYDLSYEVAGNTTGNCTIQTISTTTPGFSVSQADVPLQVPAGASVVLSFALDCPAEDYSGPLTLVLT